MHVSVFNLFKEAKHGLVMAGREILLVKICFLLETELFFPLSLFVHFTVNTDDTTFVLENVHATSTLMNATWICAA